jgi:hypothetical protein
MLQQAALFDARPFTREIRQLTPDHTFERF